MSEDLIAFLRARLDEDETTVWALGSPSLTSLVMTMHAATDAYTDRFGPARVLRDIDADRKLLALLEADVVNGRERDYEATEALEQVVRIRAERFSDHPDYQESWKP